MSADGRAGAGVVDRAEALVLGWARRYTRALADDVATRRVDELASDVWEQRDRARVVGAHPVAVAISLVARTVAGMLADLAWRHQAHAVHRSRTLEGGGRPMGRWIKDNWWVALGVINAAMAVVLGVGLPFEDRTLGSVAGGIVIATLGLAGVIGAFVRRAPDRRARGDVMIVVGQLPWLPFFWTVVFPVVGLAVIVAALTDAADAGSPRALGAASPADGDEAHRAVEPQSDLALAVLVVALVGAVAAAVVVGEPGAAYALVAPVVGFVVGHLLFRRRFAGRRAMHAGAVLVTGAAASLALLPGAIWLVEDFDMQGAVELLFAVDVVAAFVVGGLLLVRNLLGGRSRRPA